MYSSSYSLITWCTGTQQWLWPSDFIHISTSLAPTQTIFWEVRSVLASHWHEFYRVIQNYTCKETMNFGNTKNATQGKKVLVRSMCSSFGKIINSPKEPLGGGGGNENCVKSHKNVNTLWVSFEECGTVNTIIVTSSCLFVLGRLSVQGLDLYRLLLYSLDFKLSIRNSDSMYLGRTGRTMS